MENSKIAWCHHTMNWWLGCKEKFKLAQELGLTGNLGHGCDRCYARVLMQDRYKRVTWGGPRVETSKDTWQKPRRWNRKAREQGIRYRVFTLSLGDFFDQDVPQGWRGDAWKIMTECESLDWLILTKELLIREPASLMAMLPDQHKKCLPENIWFLHSVCTQDEADLVIPRMVDIPARVRGLSMEPLLEKIDFSELDLSHLHWAILGGESGKGARDFDIAWLPDMYQQITDAGLKFFMKQAGESPINSELADIWGPERPTPLHHYSKPWDDPIISDAKKAPGYTITPHQLSRYQVGDKKGENLWVIPEQYRKRCFPA